MPDKVWTDAKSVPGHKLMQMLMQMLISENNPKDVWCVFHEGFFDHGAGHCPDYDFDCLMTELQLNLRV